VNYELNSNSYSQIIIAAMNEEEGIGLTIEELLNSVDNAYLLVVDGKSTDRTVEIAKDFGAQIVFQEGKGKGDALAKGLQYLDPNVEYVVVTDADYTYPGNRVPEMITLLEANPEVGMVCGNRFNGNVNPEASKRVFRFGNKLIIFAHNALNGIPLKDPLTGLRVIRAEILRNWKIKSKGFDIEIELNHHVERRGYDIAEIDIEYRERLGEKKLKVRHGAEIIKRMILETTCSYTNVSGKNSTCNFQPNVYP
jgi:dolichol-phosphate hexosyltransferase